MRSFPPALFAGTRFFTAGSLLLALTIALRRRLPRRRSEWTTPIVIGLLLLTAGNGLVVAGTRLVESGTAAALVVGGALWMALLDAVIPGSEAKVTWAQFAGLLVGYSGTILLIGGSLDALRRADWRGPLCFVGANICWGLGSVFSKRRPVSTSVDVTAAIQMLAGGIALLGLGTVLGEWKNFAPAPIAWASIAYLIVFGSIVGYSCFAYVLRQTSPTITATYYYANTVVAVLLGWVFLGERITVRTVIAIAIILGSVIWVQRPRTMRENS